LITLAVTLSIGYALVPPVDAGYAAGILPHDQHQAGWHTRGTYNSAWVGSTVALLASVLLSLPGFYLVKNAVELDRRTRVGEILASTPLRRHVYTIGKWLSNLTVLATLAGVLAASALAMQLIRCEATSIDLWPLLSPFLLIAFPAMAVVAALGVLFEVAPWLRGGLGNAAFFFLWMAPLVAAPQADLYGLTAVVPQVEAAAQAAYPDRSITTSTGINPTPGIVDTFLWDGTRWTPLLVLRRLSWLGVAAGLALGAAPLFDRFAVASQHRASNQATALGRDTGTHADLAGRAPPLVASPSDPAPGYPFGRVFAAEMRLAVRAMPWWWHVVSLGWFIAGLLAPVDMSRTLILPLSWIWPILVWSAMGVREARHGARDVLFSAPSLIRRQLPAMWLAGVAVALITGAGTGMRMALVQEWTGLLAWAVGVLFIPSLALSLGVWTGNSRLFEALYTAAWYVGPLNGLDALDYMGAQTGSSAAGPHWYYLGITAALLPLAALGRWRQVRTG
jgi:hypothetical protein